MGAGLAPSSDPSGDGSSERLPVVCSGCPMLVDPHRLPLGWPASSPVSLGCAPEPQLSVCCDIHVRRIARLVVGAVPLVRLVDPCRIVG